MLTLIGTVLGIFSGLLPEVVKFFREREERKHELDVMDRQIEQQKIGHEQRLEEINVQADVDQERLAMQASKPEFVPLTGSKWADIPIAFANILLAIASGLVRPTITYCYFGLYAAVKWAQFAMLKVSGLQGAEALTKIWTEEDMAMFATVVTFWFSSRMFQKARAMASGSIAVAPKVLTSIP